MNRIFCCLLFLLYGSAIADSFTDPRDGKTYKTVKMPDGNIWMAENLNYNMNGSVCYGNDASNCSKYGRLYTWEDAQEACPSGWYLPSEGDFDTMLKAVGNDASKKLRVSSWGKTWTETIGGDYYQTVCARYACSYGYGSTIRDCRGSDRCDCGSGESICLENKKEKVKRAVEYVNYDTRGNDTFGFSVLPAGYYYNGYSKKFNGLGEYASFWSSSAYYVDIAKYLLVDNGSSYVRSSDKPNGLSVRCFQDSEAEIAKKRAEEEKKRAEEEKKRAEEEKKRVYEEKKRAVLGSFKDPRDGKKYNTVKMPDGKTWMAENLNYNVKGSVCYDNDASNCSKYGRLYTWEAAKKACPSGWRLPSETDIETLLEMVGGDDEERSLNLRAPSWDGGLDKYVFSVLPAGLYYGDYKEFNSLGKYANFWSSTEYKTGGNAYTFLISGFALVGIYDKTDGYSVRCLQDSNDGVVVSSSRSQTRSLDASTSRAPSEKSNTKVMTDSRDGKTYKTVKIGDQTWMAENLNYSIDGSMCYDNDASNCSKYGRLYTWEAAKKACPSGWHLPTKSEFEKLLAIAGYVEDDGVFLGSNHLRAQQGWGDVGDDKYAFTALPAGIYDGYRNGFKKLNIFTHFWSFTKNGDDYAYNLFVNTGMTDINSNAKSFGLSVRCLQD